MSARSARKTANLKQIVAKEEYRLQKKKISAILKKPVDERSEEDNCFLGYCPELTKRIKKVVDVREKCKDRQKEVEDSHQELADKCAVLADSLRNSKHAIVYTGAGISTAASIPDYRGPNGVWTLLQKGQQPLPVELSDAEPTFTHMAITSLYKEGLVKYVVSQNCDGLHLRSGLPREAISEVHGNMYLESCSKCTAPSGEYFRCFDVTECTALRRHKTARQCHKCGTTLIDTIVHFGEKGHLKSPYHWLRASKAAKKADIIVCLGTSLKVLRRYQCLWGRSQPSSARPKLYIVNLQWTPKDAQATLKINGRCNEVMELVMQNLGLTTSPYERRRDPLFFYKVDLHPSELASTSRPIIPVPTDFAYDWFVSSTNQSKPVQTSKAMPSSHPCHHCVQNCHQTVKQTLAPRGRHTRMKRPARKEASQTSKVSRRPIAGWVDDSDSTVSCDMDNQLNPESTPVQLVDHASYTKHPVSPLGGASISDLRRCASADAQLVADDVKLEVVKAETSSAVKGLGGKVKTTPSWFGKGLKMPKRSSKRKKSSPS